VRLLIFSHFTNNFTARLIRVYFIEPEAKKDNPLNIDYDEMNLSPELIQQAEEEADRILRESDPIDFILNTIAKKHIGDRDTQEAICVSIACQCCLLS
jgi:primase-polymerase (primpol)-like protein